MPYRGTASIFYKDSSSYIRWLWSHHTLCTLDSHFAYLRPRWFIILSDKARKSGASALTSRSCWYEWVPRGLELTCSISSIVYVLETCDGRCRGLLKSQKIGYDAYQWVMLKVWELATFTPAFVLIGGASQTSGSSADAVWENTTFVGLLRFCLRWATTTFAPSSLRLSGEGCLERLVRLTGVAVWSVDTLAPLADRSLGDTWFTFCTYFTFSALTTSAAAFPVASLSDDCMHNKNLITQEIHFFVLQMQSQCSIASQFQSQAPQNEEVGNAIACILAVLLALGGSTAKYANIKAQRACLWSTIILLVPGTVTR